MDTEILPGGIDRAQLAKWKNEFGDVFTLDVIIQPGKPAIPEERDTDGNVIVPAVDAMPDEVKTGWFKKPNLDAISQASKYIETEPLQAGLILFNMCYLGGDPEVQTDSELKASCFGLLLKQFQIKEARIKNW